MPIERERPDDQNSGGRRLIGAGADLVGTVVGATAGGLLAGPEGAVLGAGVSSLLKSGLENFAARILSRRQQARIGATFSIAAEALREQLERGRTTRTDGFFDPGPDQRAEAEEIIEGVLLAAQNEYQEKKIRHLGHLLAETCLRSEISASLANWLIKTTEDLTWTQLAFLAAIKRQRFLSLPNVRIYYLSYSWKLWGLHDQIEELGPDRRALIDAPPLLSLDDDVSGVRFDLSSCSLLSGGDLLYEMLRLDLVEDSEIVSALDDIITEVRRLSGNR